MAMLSGIDHIVIVVRDLDAAIADYSQLGFTVVRGGRHSGLDTHNALIALADGAYLELIAFIPLVAANPHPWFGVLQKGGSIADFCAITNDLESDLAALRNAGAALGAPFAMSRERPDGYRLEWVLAVNEGPTRGIVPFLIRDITPRDERVPRERVHRNNARAVQTLTIAVEDLSAAQNVYAAALGRGGEPVTRADLEAAGVRFMLGSHAVELVAPRSPSGPVARYLRQRGSAPFELALDGGGNRRVLDPAASQGARIILT